MRDNPNEYEIERGRRRPTAGDRAPRSPNDLQAIVVRYENRPDRCTVTPRACPDGERLTAWLSADLDAFVDLEALR